MNVTHPGVVAKIRHPAGYWGTIERTGAVIVNGAQRAPERYHVIVLTPNSGSSTSNSFPTAEQADEAARLWVAEWQRGSR